MKSVQIGEATLYLGDSRDILPTLEGIDATVTDPPYGLSFMGKRWDYDVPDEEIWAACLAAMKPGAHLLAFAGTRTQHRMAVRIEDAGFEIRDMIAWVYGSGFPKSLDVSKAIDKAAGAEREDLGPSPNWREAKRDNGQSMGRVPNEARITAPATDAAREWQGWGTALKPALEPITVARKPLSGTVAANVQEHGTGALNIDGCRVATSDDLNGGAYTGTGDGSAHTVSLPRGKAGEFKAPPGRWPANFIHDGSDDVVALFPDTKSGALNAGHKQGAGSFGKVGGDTILRNYGNDSGSAARFFYCAKASKKDRDEGLDDAADAARRMFASGGRSLKDGQWVETDSEPRPRKNPHPTVKPTDLMRYLCRLVTPPGGIVLDPFMGSGSTGKAAMLEGFRFIGIERDPHYFEIACRRIEDIQRQRMIA